MKCPNCGKEIPDGSLFCENCAAEIRIVPEYETRLEEQISRGMESVTRVFDEESIRRVATAGRKESESGEEDDSADQKEESSPDISSQQENAEGTPVPHYISEAAARRQAKYEARRRQVTMMLFFIIGAISAAVVLIALYIGAFRTRSRNVSYYVGQAYDMASDGEYEGAAGAIDQAIALAQEEDDGTSSSSLYLLKSEYLLKAGEKDLALGAASEALYADNVSEEEEIAAYGQIIAIYASYEEYDRIAELLSECDSTFILESYPQYTLYAPEFSLEEGEYEDSIQLELTDQGQGSIFYTLDGSEPTTSSQLYTGPIELKEGIYEVSAVYVNHFGLQSEVITKTYTVIGSVPDAPVISPNSGTYAKQMTITASLADSAKEEDSEEEQDARSLRVTGSIYYTTDGTDPTLDSQEYTGPIAMPQGTTTYRFAVITEDGVSSEVVERQYTYKIAASLSAEDGINYILIALINRGEIVDTIGTLPGGTARFNFTYVGLEQIHDSGNFLIYTESLVDNAGNSADTGRVYAVNAANGTVNLYSEDVLTPIG